jgi:uncharacterized protein
MPAQPAAVMNSTKSPKGSSMPRWVRKWWVIAGAVLSALLIGAVLMVEVVLPRMFVVPSRTHYDPAAPADTPLKENLQFTAFDTTTSDGLTLKCWFVPASPQPAARTVLILHGWGGSKEWVRELIALVVRNGWNAVAYDSRAHGASGGRYMSYGMREKDDVTAVLNQVEAQFKNIGPFGILGISYGGAVTTQDLGQEPRLRCGVIISSFCRLEDVARVQMRLMTGCCNDWLFHRVLARGENLAGFRVSEVQPTEAAHKVTQPTLVIHGAHDNLCPVEDAHQLFEHIASKDKAWFAAEHADHFHILESSDRPEIDRRIVAIFRRKMPATTFR